MDQTLPGFRIKYSGIEIEFYSNESTSVRNQYDEVMKWLRKTVEKKLTDLELEIIRLKEDLAATVTIQAPAPPNPKNFERRLNCWKLT